MEEAVNTFRLEDAPAAQETVPRPAEPVTKSFWAYSGIAAYNCTRHAIVVACRRANPAELEALPNPVGFGASVLEA